MHLTTVALSFLVAFALPDDPKQKEAAKPTRTVEGQILSSKEKPAIRLQFDKAFKYIGGHSFILYDVAQAEQHFFVDADDKGKVKRFYWLQFEGYLPSNTHTYRYKVTKIAKVGDLEFVADGSARNIKTSNSRPNSDSQHAQAFLESKGYRMASDNVLSQRLLHLVDEKKRDELMIIYMEDLAPMNLTAADLAPNGKAHAQWEDISTKLLERALQGMKLVK